MLVTPGTNTEVNFFQAGVLFSIENAQFWLYCCDFVAILRNLWCTFTGSNNPVVHQNWQISDMDLPSLFDTKMFPKTPKMCPDVKNRYMYVFHLYSKTEIEQRNLERD